jgi:transposase
MTLKLNEPRLEFALQDEIRRTKESRYDHRLHAILLIASGMSCPEVSNLLGDPQRSIRRWIHRYNHYGFSGLMEADHQGRPSRLTSVQMENILLTLKKKPEEIGLRGKKWNGKLLSEFIRKQFGVRLGIRQSQRLFYSMLPASKESNMI